MLHDRAFRGFQNGFASNVILKFCECEKNFFEHAWCLLERTRGAAYYCAQPFLVLVYVLSLPLLTLYFL
ncbi:hypothetical protein E2542_SST07194 [Spatholobus suberectus]|nr:hypothetical protein E2542_SST07194 [Spatholobus suberectus]